MKGSNFVMFLAGTAVGAVSAWFYCKKKYELIAQEEIESVKEVYSAQRETDIFMSNVADAAEMEEDKNTYETLAASYNTETKEEKKEGDSKPVKHSHVSVIPPDEFGDDENYDTATLFLFEDGVLTDVDYDVIDDVDLTVGLESLDYFGEWEDDSVSVKNDDDECYYEILKDTRKYSELNPKVEE